MTNDNLVSHYNFIYFLLLILFNNLAYDICFIYLKFNKYLYVICIRSREANLYINVYMYSLIVSYKIVYKPSLEPAARKKKRLFDKYLFI